MDLQKKIDLARQSVHAAGTNALLLGMECPDLDTLTASRVFYYACCDYLEAISCLNASQATMSTMEETLSYDKTGS